MSQNLTIAGVGYSGVAQINVPTQSGGTASYPDTSDATATAADIASGKTAYAGGSKLTGTLSGGGGGFSGTPAAGDTPVLMASTYSARPSGSSALAATGISITVPIAGTYRFKWVSDGGSSSSYVVRSRLYKNGTAVGTSQNTTYSGDYSLDLTCAAGDVVALWAKGYSYLGTTMGSVGGLIACIDWDNGF